MKYDAATSWEYCSQEVVILVKGISRQVIVVQSPDPKLFEQAIFILKDEAINRDGITDDALIKEAKRIINMPSSKRKRAVSGPVWACGGALITGLIWLLTVFL